MGKKWLKFARFLIFKFSNSQSCDNFQKVAKNIKGILFFSLLSYLLCNQIWLNYFLDDCHFGYITNSLKETLFLPSLGALTLNKKMWSWAQWL
jgi:hypothetical protein